jgi:hypothetical protein
MKKSELRSLINEELNKILKESFANKLFTDESIEDALRKVSGYETMTQLKSGDLLIYFKNKNSAIKGATLLSKIAPGYDYINNIDSSVDSTLIGDSSVFILIEK